ncbi:uncharacterized protein SPAPADRAFT_63492 [Spathaspora passalidarum NRRL Y-27907]|uniref:DUF2415 domain-containing protein n=1 Tax=Spathaspora passalidarum (strain NRRL Y-27907 / 11-Y1) TaxID=619300 RepID=G3AV70_SPAPN|nr:uncharacterized protein SPAPADRAFT_63492 [Spathaspora passalidarum NRRL Y-27907]EGW29873.1 hypothetical protein SPAPADRAFT_63492 [Spathaspora passalidarum NRRL Y-27907]
MTIDVSHPNKLKTINNFSNSSVSKKKSKFINSSQQYNKCFQNYYHSYEYLKPNPIYIPHIRPSVNHWQLRDLLKFNEVEDLVYYTRDDSIYSYDLNKETTKNYIKLNYYPRCFSHHDDIIVTGGLLTSSSKLFSLNLDNLTSTNTNIPARRIAKGLFSFYSPKTHTSKTVKLGEMINNDVTIYPSSTNSYQSYVCNNDTHLYGLDINNNGNIKVTCKINCEINTCLNNVVQNPRTDKILTATGDSSSIFLIDPHQPKPIIKTIKSGHESGFGVSYHPNGYLFSTVFQDGTCQIYDIRNLKSRLIDIKSTRPGHQSGAFRVCKFSPANDMNDLLIISEHVGRVHLIDLRNLDYDNVDDHQVIVVPVALDQFGDYQATIKNPHLIKRREERALKKKSQDVMHKEDITEPDEADVKPRQKFPVAVYPQTSDSFTAPIVYDYDYLTNVSPRLFKEFSYIPPPPPPAPMQYNPPPKLNYPQWNESGPIELEGTSIEHVSPTSSARPSISQTIEDFDTNPDVAAHLESVYNSMDWASAPPGIAPSMSTRSDSYIYSNYCDDSYQQCTNHIHGEMELSGIEFCDPHSTNDSKIMIGCQDAGILMWDINGVSRRSFGRFDYV